MRRSGALQGRLQRVMATDIHTVRRLGVQALFQDFAEKSIASGEQPWGLDAAFATKLQMSAATWSMAKSGKRPIGDKLARQIEATTGKPEGWLDEAREPQGLSQAEQQFMAMALNAWRSTNSDGRKKLKDLMRQMSGSGK